VLRTELLYWSLHSPQTATLICAPEWQPMERVLVLDQSAAPATIYMTTVARLCRAFHCTPVVLTVARSEKVARQRQYLAEQALAAEELTGDFDVVIGCEVRAAVALAAQCRRCTHVVVEKQQAPSWWRWLRGDVFERLLGLGNSLTFLALSGVGNPLPVAGQAKAAPTQTKLTAPLSPVLRGEG
jgi:K+-sensing histidine kinase KdpD